MKKAFTITLFITIFYHAGAQLTKGSVVIGGSMNFSRNNEAFDAGSILPG